MSTKKIIQALDYVAWKQPDHTLDNMKAYKLLWLADRYHLRQYGRTITGDEYHALPHGVVPSDAKCILESQGTKLPHSKEVANEYLEIFPVCEHTYKALKAPNMKVFSESDIEVLDIILSKFNSMTPLELSEFSHQFPEWKQYEESLKNPQKKNGYKIDLDLFFENKEEASGLFKDSPELLELTKEVYHQYKGC